jgi:hypothetical protein
MNNGFRIKFEKSNRISYIYCWDMILIMLEWSFQWGYHDTKYVYRTICVSGFL